MADKPQDAPKAPEADPADGPYTEKRARLLLELETDARDTAFYTGRKMFSDRPMSAMAQVLRHEFVNEGNEVVAFVPMVKK
ncbi:MAG: hypothetical protein VW268_08530 [Rhodospirillaceae bacterium]